MSTSKILILDIETRPSLAYVWGLYNENIPLARLIEPSEIIAVGAKWYGKRGYFYEAVPYVDGQEYDPLARPKTLGMVHRLLNEADAVVTYNGDKFDLPKLYGEFARCDMVPPAPVASIDVYKTVAKMGFASGKMEHVAPLLGCGEKLPNDGFSMWSEYLKGSPKARRDMRRYNLRDVGVLDTLYTKLRPFIKLHPHLGQKSDNQCPACESTHVQLRGKRRTRKFWIERLHCQDCGAWSDGAKRKVGSVKGNPS